MIDIIVNGKNAVVKQGISIDFVRENPDFSTADEYSLNICFPLDVTINVDIFGNIGLHSSDIADTKYNCRIVGPGVHLFGVLCVVSVNETEVNCQFLSGRSAANYDLDLSESYINELDLGYQAPNDLESGFAVCLPWVNEESGCLNNPPSDEDDGDDGEAQPRVYPPGSGAYRPFTSGVESNYMNYQPYLIGIAKRIGNVLGFTCDFTEWDNSNDRFLLICNSLPGIWLEYEYNSILPHWSVKDFFEQVGLLLGGYFEFDLYNNVIKFQYRTSRYLSSGYAKIDVFDDFSVDVSDKPDVEYIGSEMVSYESRSDDRWKFDCCDWYIAMYGRTNVISFSTFSQLRDYAYNNFSSVSISPRPGAVSSHLGINKLLYAYDRKSYYVIQLNDYTVSDDMRNYSTSLVPVNFAGALNYRSDDDNARSVELGCIPVCIDYTEDDYGFCMFMKPSVASSEDYDDTDAIIQTGPIRSIRRGEDDSKHEYYSNILVAFWNNETETNAYDQSLNCPWVDDLTIDRNWAVRTSPFSLRLNSSQRTYLVIDDTKKYEFSFLHDSFLDVQHIFVVRGKLYLCAKLTAQLTEDGLSQRFKGEFYRITKIRR